MAAKLTPRVQELVTEAAELPADELAALLEAISELPSRAETVPNRHAVIAERIARVQAGDVSTLSMEQVEAALHRDLDF
jgi:hypothetical protein